MDEIKFNTIDLFAGCGGLLEGFKATRNYNTVACVEWEKAPVENLARRLETKWGYSDAKERVLRFDIQRTDELFNGWKDDPVYGNGIGLNKLIEKHGQVDIVIGGPPCQAYSLAGRIRDENGMRDDYRNFLFESYLEVVKKVKPKLFIFENVPGMLSAKPGNTPVTDLISQAFDEAGFDTIDNFKDAILDATEYGVPQSRKRVILLGVNRQYFSGKTKEMISVFYNQLLPQLKVEKTKTVYDAIANLPKIFPAQEDYKYEGKKYSHQPPESLMSNHIPRYHNRRDIETFYELAEDIQSGRNKYVSTEALKEYYTNKTGKKSNVHKYYVLRWNQPSNTIPAHLYKDGLRHIHPDPNQARSITVREAARLQTFLDDYSFSGSSGDQYKMIGNAVPPKLAEALAIAVKQLLNGEYNKPVEGTYMEQPSFSI